MTLNPACLRLLQEVYSISEMKKILLVFLFVLMAYLSFDKNTADARVTLTHTDGVQVAPSAPVPGSPQSPLIFALASFSSRQSGKIRVAGESLALQLETLSGYHIVTTIHASEVEIVQAFSLNNAHLAILTPLAYLQVRREGTAHTALASTRHGEMFYGAQFITRSETEFISYFNAIKNQNTADAIEALKQFNDKKPCWSDVSSLSAYVVPLGYLNQAQVRVRAPAFLEGQGPVIRAIYAGGICDFGATYIDARQLATLEGDYPDVLEKVDVIWRIPPIIPYENVSFSASLPLEMRRVLLRAFIDLMGTQEGKTAMQTMYGITALTPVEDALYDEFAEYVEASGVYPNVFSD